MRKNTSKNKGFTLLEVLVYMAILGTVVIFFFNIFSLFFEGESRWVGEREVERNLNYITERLKKEILDANDITILERCPFNKLKITYSDNTTSIISVSGTRLIIEKNNTFSYLTSNDVTVTTTDCLFKKISAPSPAKPALQFKPKIIYNKKVPFSDEREVIYSLR